MATATAKPVTPQALLKRRETRATKLVKALNALPKRSKAKRAIAQTALDSALKALEAQQLVVKALEPPTSAVTPAGKKAKVILLTTVAPTIGCSKGFNMPRGLNGGHGMARPESSTWQHAPRAKNVFKALEQLGAVSPALVGKKYKGKTPLYAALDAGVLVTSSALVATGYCTAFCVRWTVYRAATVGMAIAQEGAFGANKHGYCATPAGIAWLATL